MALALDGDEINRPNVIGERPKRPPAWMGWSCFVSPMRTSLPCAEETSDTIRAMSFDDTMPASSTTNTAPTGSDCPRSQPAIQDAIVREEMPDDCSNPCAALPDNEAPHTRFPEALQASLATASIVDLPAPANPTTVAKSLSKVT